MNFQERNGLPVTGEPDDATTARIEQEIAVLDQQPFKKKLDPNRRTFKPGEVVPGQLVAWKD